MVFTFPSWSLGSLSLEVLERRIQKQISFPAPSCICPAYFSDLIPTPFSHTTTPQPLPLFAAQGIPSSLLLQSHAILSSLSWNTLSKDHCSFAGLIKSHLSISLPFRVPYTWPWLTFFLACITICKYIIYVLVYYPSRDYILEYNLHEGRDFI